jgi:hypothetical protein
MNKFVFVSIWFTLGAVVSAGVTYAYAKNKFGIECQEEIDKLIEHYEKPIDEEAEEEKTDTSDGVLTYKKEKKTNSSEIKYNKLYSGGGIEVSKNQGKNKTTPEIMNNIERSDRIEIAENKTEKLKNSDSFAEYDNPWASEPIVIPEQEFTKNIDDFYKHCLFWTKDAKLIDADGDEFGDEIDIDDVIGLKNLGLIDKCDVVYIRNDRLEQMFEIREESTT